jgi:hypothetical protein
MTAFLITLAVFAVLGAVTAGLLSADRLMTVAVCWYRLRYATTFGERARGAGVTAAALGITAAAGTSCLLARAASAGCDAGNRKSFALIDPDPRKAAR